MKLLGYKQLKTSGARLVYGALQDRLDNKKLSSMNFSLYSNATLNRFFDLYRMMLENDKNM